MIGTLALAFAAGSIATVNPCGLALLPAYIARRVAANDGARTVRETVARALAAGAAMTAGVFLIFGTGGGAMVLGASWLVRVFPWAGFGMGVILTMVGIAVVAGHRIGLRVPIAIPEGAVGGPRGDLLFGIGYGTVSLSCTVPILLAVTGIAVTGGGVASAFSLAAYALGMGTVLTALAVAAALARGGLLSAAGRLRPYMSRASGMLLLLSGLYIVYVWGSRLFAEAPPLAGNVSATAERLSGALRGWMGATGGQVTLFGLLGLLGVIAVWALWRRTASRPRFGRGDCRNHGAT